MSALMPVPAHLLRNWRFGAVTIWAVGVQTSEAVATAGLAAFGASFLVGLAGASSAEVLSSLRSAAKSYWPLWLFIVWALVAPLATGTPPSGSGVARMLDWAAIPLLAASAGDFTPRQWRALAVAASATLALSGFAAGLQSYGLWPDEAAFSYLWWTKIPVHRVYEPVPGAPDRFMGGGLLFHRLKFGHISSLAVVGAIVASAHLRGKWRLTVAVLGTAGFLAVWLFPFARMAALAMTCSSALTLALVLPSPRRALLAGGTLAAVGALVLLTVAPLRERFASALTESGSGQRSFHLAAAVEAIRQHPLAGVGLGRFRPSLFAREDMPDEVRAHPGKAHNQFLSLAAETGIPGGLFFLGALLWLVLEARKKVLGALTLGALTAFVLLSLAHDPLFHAPFSMGLVLMIGLGLQGDTLARKSR